MRFVLSFSTVPKPMNHPLTAKHRKSPVLGIDGGGTHCRFALVDGNTHTVVEGGPANATTDLQATVVCINAGLQELAAKSGVRIDELHEFPSFVGLAGVKSDEIIAELTKALPLSKARYSEDRLAAVRGALGERDGFLVHCGTGSFFASQRNNQLRFAGGWGSVLGDEASAYWVAREALSLVLKQQDGFLPPSSLATALLKQCDGAQGIVSFASHAKPAELAKLAPMVTTHASGNDALALTVMQSAANYIDHGLVQLDWSSGMPICLSGGIGTHCKAFLPIDKQEAVVEPIGTPLDGAVQLALELL